MSFNIIDMKEYPFLRKGKIDLSNFEELDGFGFYSKDEILKELDELHEFISKIPSYAERNIEVIESFNGGFFLIPLFGNEKYIKLEEN